jgi:hypothetical protein
MTLFQLLLIFKLPTHHLVREDVQFDELNKQLSNKKTKSGYRPQRGAYNQEKLVN